MNVLSADELPAPDKMYSAEVMGKLKDCVDALSLKDKLFIELFFEKKLGFEQLKVLFDSSRASIDMRKARVIEKLRKCFKRKNIPLDLR